MSAVLLSQIIARYINSWEGHTQNEGQNYIILRDKLKNATIEELNEEYNKLTALYLWNDPLLDLFYNEFRDRMFSETTFSISTSWNSAEKWLSDPFVLIMVGFEDEYPVINGDGLFLEANNLKDQNHILAYDKFTDKFQEKIIRLLLNNNVDAIVDVNEDKNTINIVGLGNEHGRISFDSDSLSDKTIEIKASIRGSPDWNLYRQIYTSLKNQQPAIMIDQLESSGE
jgi:hypothetical protein